MRSPTTWYYKATFENDGAYHAEDALEACPEDGLAWARDVDELRRDLLLTKLRHRLSDTLYAYRASRTQFEPYQFKPVLKFLASGDQRLLIADEVGLGKTIEAAVIYLELKARLEEDLRRVLVVCPSRLKAKWHDELSTRFDERFEDLDANGIRRLFQKWDNRGALTTFRAIASYETLRREDLAQGWAERGIRLDLLIADEAHTMRNPIALVHDLGGILTDNADATVFLTATPVMLDNTNLFHLLRLLAPDRYSDYLSFQMENEPSRFVNAAAQLVRKGRPTEALKILRRVEQTPVRERFLRDPRYLEAVAHVEALILATESSDSRERVLAQRKILDLHPLGGILTRTTKRQVTQAATRVAYTERVVLSPAERAFYDAFLAQARRDAAVQHGQAAVFAIIMRERMAASCLAAVRASLERAAAHHAAVSIRVERTEHHLAAEDEEEEQAAREQLKATQGLLGLARAVGEADAKFDAFAEALRQAFAAAPERKVLVFSYFRGTLDYLYGRLGRAGYRVGILHGGIPVPDRQRIIEQFRSKDGFQILLSSEVGAEGLDFQFCDVLVNYDLPWNPMQVEQRIGRLDRFGQKAERIGIYNFVLEETIETRILARLQRVS